MDPSLTMRMYDHKFLESYSQMGEEQTVHSIRTLNKKINGSRQAITCFHLRRAELAYLVPVGVSVFGFSVDAASSLLGDSAWAPSAGLACSLDALR